MNRSLFEKDVNIGGNITEDIRNLFRLTKGNGAIKGRITRDI